MQEYQKKKELEQLTQPAASIPSAYEKEFSPEEKENLFKEVYSNIVKFEELFYEEKVRNKKMRQFGEVKLS